MIQYRKAIPGDAGAMVKLRIAFLEEVQREAPPCDRKALVASLEQYFVEGFRNDRYIAWLATDGDLIVGTSGLTFYHMPPSFKNLPGGVAYIMNMYTIPGYRKRGIASALFERIIAEAGALGYKKLSLHATAMGRPLYAKYGFKDEGKEMVLRIA